MLISHKFQFVTIDIPKTGTRSYRQTLHIDNSYVDVMGVPSPLMLKPTDFYQHEKSVDAIQKFKILNWKWEDYFKYTTIRNPWARCVSYYMWTKTVHQRYIDKDLESLPITPRMHFSTFDKLFKRCNFDTKKILHRLIQNQSSQDTFFLVDGKIVVDYIGQMENIQNDFLVFCSKVGINPPPTLRHENKSPEYDYRDFYDQELIDLVAEKEKYVIDHYGYQY